MIVQTTSVGQTNFRIVKHYDEFKVKVRVRGTDIPSRTYFTDDLEDAKVTLKAMVAEETRIQERIDKSG